jgi:hypothetical protein
MSIEAIERDFPSLLQSGYRITSDESVHYNCVAWALGDINNWWEPHYYWPAGVPEDGSLAAYVKLFEFLGFAICTTTDMEPAYEKIALFGEHGEFLHVPRQLPGGFWTSKLGPNEDIEHSDVRGLCGTEYGSVTHVLRRAADQVT